MSGVALSNQQAKKAVGALERRASQILKARPAYREMVDFYLTVFSLQLERSDGLNVHPEPVDDERWGQCHDQGTPLIELCDPGIDPESLVRLWAEMKKVFGRGNDVLRRSLEKIEDAERAGELVPATWLAELRPERLEMAAEAAERIGIEESVLASLARAVTYPHWNCVARTWLSEKRSATWQRFRCPTCGAAPGLAEMRPDRVSDANIKPPERRFMHCSFCGSRWMVPALTCPHCGTTRSGDAKYLHSPTEADVRIDFCRCCRRYVKVIKADKGSSPLHVGLELLTTAHLDQIAQENDLCPLETNA